MSEVRGMELSRRRKLTIGSDLGKEERKLERTFKQDGLARDIVAHPNESTRKTEEFELGKRRGYAFQWLYRVATGHGRMQRHSKEDRGKPRRQHTRKARLHLSR